MQVRIFKGDVRDLAVDCIDSKGHLRVMPAAYYASTTQFERSVFGVRHGLYLLPTTELVEYLSSYINHRNAIEIGSGNGGLARALGIPATDNHQQNDPWVREFYRAHQQPTVSYGQHVEKLEALEAVRRYRPAVVIGAWVSHRSDDGNAFGIDESTLLEEVEEYILIGNDKVHHQKPIWQRPHQKITPHWLYSRAFDPALDFIAIWKRDGKAASTRRT